MRAWLRIAVGAIFTFLLVAPLKSEDQLSQEVEVEVEESKPKAFDGIRIDARGTAEGNENMFQATDEWQVVQPGQVLPPGLHVEHNLQTGITRAKLNSPDEQASNGQQSALVTTEQGQMDENAGDGKAEEATQTDEPSDEGKSGPKIRFADDDEFWKRVVREQRAKDNLERAFRELEKDFANSDDAKEDVAAEEAKPEGEKADFPFRTVDQIRDELSVHGKVEIRTDAELLRKLIGEYLNATAEQRIAILRDFELLLHSLDNAVVFTDLGGLDLLFGELAAQNDSLVHGGIGAELVEHALHALGAALQSNDYVQKAAARSSACDVLVTLLTAEFSRLQSRATGEEEDSSASQQFESIRLSRLLFAISALLRASETAQTRFTELGGFSLLTQVFNAACNNGAMRIAKKITALLRDLIVEHESTEGEYVSVLADLGWCSLPVRATKILQNDAESNKRPLDHDAIEKQLELLKMMLRSEACREQLSHDTRSVGSLRRLESTYRQLTDGTADDDAKSYLSELLRTISSLLASASQHTHRSVDEL